MKTVFITGASSGLGSALAKIYAAPEVTLGLAARRRERLAALAKQCKVAGAIVHTYVLDVTNGPDVARAANDFVKKTGPTDIIIANAGVGGWKHPIHDQAEALTDLMNTNVNGVINTIMAFVPHLVAARRGHLVATSSIAAFARLPRGAYSASKVAVRYLMDSWRIDLAPYGISVTTIYPGFVTTEMTDRPGARYPFLVSAEAAARAIQCAIAARRRNFIFPWPWRWLMPLARFVPDWLWRRALPWEESSSDSVGPPKNV